MTRLSIVALAQDDWHGPWMNRQQLLSRLAARHDIVYSQGPFKIWDRGSAPWQAAPWRAGWEQADGVLIDRPGRVPMRWPRFPAIDRAVARAAARRWRRALPADQPLVALLFNPAYGVFVEHLSPDHVVFHAHDRYSGFPGWTPEDEASLRALTERADLVTAPAASIAAPIQGYRDDEIRILGNGADVEAFIAAVKPGWVEPESLAGIPHPRIGYVGNLNTKVDFALIAALAEREPDWRFVFVGKRGYFDARSREGLERCDALANVHFLGHQPHQALPAFNAAMDVNMMCYRVDEGIWAADGYPLKLHEYLATARPVVASDLVVLRDFIDVLRIANGVDDWHAAIVDALDNGGVGDVESRRAVARRNSWDQRVTDLDAMLQAVVAGSSMPTR